MTQNKNLNLKNKIFLRFFSVFVFILTFFFLPNMSSADVLLPGNINTCGELAVPGTYTLTSNVSGGSSTCFTVSSDNVIIEGGNFTISGTGSTAIDGRAYTSNVLTVGANGYTNLVINDLILSGYTIGVNLSGNSDGTGSGVNNGYGGDAGDVEIFYSYIGSIISNGGNTTTQSFGGLGGNIAFTDTDLNISNSNITALGGTGTSGRNTNGGLDLNYSGTLTKNSLTLSALSFLKDNATTYSSYTGGFFPVVPGNINSCEVNLTGSGTYTLTQDVVSTSTCFFIRSNNIIINGNGYSITAATTTGSTAISVGSYSNFTLASTTVNVFTNIITSSAPVTISGHNLNLNNKYIGAGSLTLAYTGALNKIGATISALSSLVVNGVSYGSRLAGPLDYWTPRDSSRGWYSVASSADGTKLAAVVFNGQIYTSTDSGVTWTARDSSRYWSSVASSADGTKLAAVVQGGQIYTSSDSGVTWTARDSSRNWFSITSSADGTKLAAVVQGGQIYTSSDSGATWTARESSRQWYSIASSADGTKLAAVVQGGQIYTSTDSGVTWTARDSSRQWWSITSNSSGDKLAAVAYNGQIYTSTDSGVTWTARDSSRQWQSITSNSSGDKLAAAVYGGQIYTSADSGVTWTARDSSRGWRSVTSSSDGTKLAAVVEGGQIHTYENYVRTLSVDILTPQSSSVYSTWSTSVSWGSATSCYYSYNNWVSTSTANCVLSGSDISNPGLGSHTLYVKGIDVNSIIVQKNVSFSISLPITITTPISGSTVTTWNPVINWDPGSAGNITSCYYSYDNFVSTSTASCSRAGGDILPPSITGTSTLYLKVVNSNGNIGSSNVVFVYSPSVTVTWTARESSRNWESITSSADGTKLAAVANNSQIYTSTDSGVTWTARDSSRSWYSIASNSSGDKLAAVVGGGQIYTSTDSGVTWTARDSSRQWQSITSNSSGDKLAAVVYNGQIYTSTDSGVSWTARDSSRSWRSITSNSSGDKLAAVASSDQIYTSTDSGVTWTARDSSRGWYSITSNSSGDKLAAVAYNGQIYTSSDSGATWTARDSSRGWYSITSNSSGDKLAAVVVGGQIYTSSDSVFITSPTSASTISTWSPSVAWLNSLTCQYSYDNSTWSNASCAGTGSDIVAPSTYGQKTLYIRGTDFQNTISTSSVLFTYSQILSGNSISSCGTISTSGTYTLTQNITDVSGTCFVVSANNVTMNGGGFGVTATNGNTSNAVTSGSYTGLTLQDINFSGFGQDVSSGQSITYSGTDVDLSNSTTTVASLVISYTNSLTILNTYFSNLSSLIINSIDLGSITAGLFTWNQQNISTCQTISSPGYYKLTANISNVSGTCFNITSDKVIIDGNGYTLSGANGNTNYAIVATSTNANAYTNIGIKNLTVTGFGGGVDARGGDGVTGDTLGKNGGTVTLHTITFPTNTLSVNTRGGDGFYESNTTATGGNAGNIKVTNSTLGEVVLSGGDTNGDLLVGADNGTVYGGSVGTITNTNSTIVTTTASVGAGYIPGCTDNSYTNYNSAATYNDGTCVNLNIGTEIDNPQGNTITGPIDFYYYHNYGTVTGSANFYDREINYSNSGGGSNNGTTTGYAYFSNNYSGSGAHNNGYVGGGADFGSYSSNYGVVDGSVTFQNGYNYGTINGYVTTEYGGNYGTINGNADFGEYGSYYGSNYGTVNGDAVFYSNDYYNGHYNYGIVTGTITYYYGCTDSQALNYEPNALNSNGSCLYYGGNTDLPQGVTYTGDLNFVNGYQNYGTVNGNAIFSLPSSNQGTTTGNATFSGYYTGVNHDSADNTLYVDGSFYYSGTGIVGGTIYDTNGTVINDVNFSNGSVNNNTTQGDSVFNDSSSNNSLVVGNTIFNDSSSNNSLVVGNTIFNDSSYNQYGSIIGNATFNTTYYASTTPTGGVMSFENANWSGSITGQVLGSDSNPITTYIFYNSTRNDANIVGDAIFYDSSYNLRNISGNVVYMNASNGTLELTGSQQWAGTITGTIKGADGIDITNIIFSDSSSNQITISTSTTVVFNDTATNNGVIQGDATFNGTNFRIGTVNGTATLSGLAQTIRGVSNVVNFVKQALTRDVLYIQQGATLNISGLATIFGADADNLLTIRSISPSSNANININGTLNVNFLRLKNITNGGLSQDVSTKTVFDDGSNQGFVFRSNATPSSRGGTTSTYTPPVIPPSRLPPVVTPPTTTPTPTTVVTSTHSAQSGTIDSFFTKNIAPLVFKNNTNFDVITSNGKNAGNAYVPNALKNLKINPVLNFTKLPTNFLGNLYKLLPTASESSFTNYTALTKYFFLKGIDISKPKDMVKLGSKPVNISTADEIDVPGVYILNYSSNITYDKTTGDIIQTVKVKSDKGLSISLLGDKKITGVYANQSIVFNSAGKVQTLNITAPTKPGIYTLKTSGSPMSLMIEVLTSTKVNDDEVKKSGFINWLKRLFK